MEVNEVKQQIKSNKLDKWYIFCGEEREVAKVYIRKMAEKSRRQIVYADTIIDVVNQPKSKAFIVIPKLYVVMDDKDFLTNEKAWAAIDRAIKDDIVVFWYSSQDARLKFWKKFKDRAVEFKKLDDRILKRHMMKDLDIKHKQKLIDVCQGDYGKILLEQEKIEKYPDAEANNILDLLIDDGTIITPSKDAIFDFVNAVLDRDVDLAYDLLRQSEDIGESNLALISVMYNSFRNLLSVQTGRQDSGLNAWQIRQVSDYVNLYSDVELIHALRVIRRCERGVKIGCMPENIVVHYCLSNII